MPSGIPVILAAPLAVAIVYALKRTPLKKYLDPEVRRG
jgi:hypothetical protein